MKKFTYDMFDHIKQPTFILSSVSHHHYGVITNIDPESISFTFNMNGAQEGSFEVHKYMDGTICPLWEKIRSLRYVYVPEHKEYYNLEVTLSEGDTTIKQCTLTSASEYELANKLITSLEINTDPDFDYQEYTNQYGYKVKEYSLSTLYKRNDPSDPNSCNEAFSILHRVLHDKCPDWTIAHCDASIANEWGEFSISNQTVYDVFTNTLAKEFDCLFQFDSVNRTISVYDLLNKCNHCGTRGDFTDVCPECGSTDISRGYGEDSGIFISYDNYSEKMTVDGDEGNVKNCFYVTGGDDYFNDMVRSCNPTRSNYIYNFSAMDYDDMPEDLVNALTDYSELVETNRSEYEVALKNYYKALNDYYWYKTSMMPRTGLTRWQPSTHYTSSASQFIYVKTLPTWAYLECSTEGDSGLEEFDATTVYEGQTIIDGDIDHDAVIWTVRRIKFQEGKASDQVDVIKNYFRDNSLYFLGDLPGIPKERSSNVSASVSINNAVKNLAKVAVGSLFKIDIITNDSSYYAPQVTPSNKWYGCIKIVNSSDKEDVYILDMNTIGDTYKPTLVSVNGTEPSQYNNYLNYWEQQIKSRMSKEENTYDTIFKIDSLTRFVQELKKYGLDRLTSFRDSYSAALEVLSSQGINSPSKKYLDTYDLYTPIYLPLHNKLVAIDNEINRPLVGLIVCTNSQNTPIGVSWVDGSGTTIIGGLAADENAMGTYYFVPSGENIYVAYECEAGYFMHQYSWVNKGTYLGDYHTGDPIPEKSGRAAYVKYLYNDLSIEGTTGEEGQVQKYLGQLDEIATRLNMKSFLDNYQPPAPYWNMFHGYIRESTYNNSNYISGDRSDGAVLNDAQKLLKIANVELKKASELQYTLSDSLKNLLNTEEFAPFKNKFELGEYLYCKADDKLYKLRLIQVKYDYGNPDSLNVSFSNVTKIEGYFSDVKNILNQAQSMGSTYQTNMHQVDKNTQTTFTMDSWIRDGLNTALAKIKNNNMEEVTIDNQGVISRQYDDVTEAYDDKQVRITHNALEFTKDNWKTASLALGEFSYRAYINGEITTVDNPGYGLISEFVSSGHVYGSEIIAGNIYSDNYNNSTKAGAHLDLSNGNFSLANGKMTWDNSSLKIDGNITASTGTIGGWKIEQNQLINGSGNLYIKLDSLNKKVETRNGDNKIELSAGALYHYYNNTMTSAFRSEHYTGTSSGSNKNGTGIDIEDGSYFSLGYYNSTAGVNSPVLMINNGLNPLGYTQEMLVFGDARFDSGVTFGSSVTHNATVYMNNNVFQWTVGQNDWALIGAGGGVNAGYLELATGDDGAEPIYVTQNTGAWTSKTVTNIAYLLDGNGNTSFPHNLTTGGNLVVKGTLSGSSATTAIPVRSPLSSDRSITSTGNIQGGSLTSTGTISASGNITTTDSLLAASKVRVGKITWSGTKYGVLAQDSGSSYTLMFSNGNIRYTGTCEHSSSIKIKKNVKDLTLEEAMNILKLNPVSYNLKVDNSEHRGFIAEDLKKVYPNLVSETGIEESPYTINDLEMIPYIIKCIQDIYKRLEGD